MNINLAQERTSGFPLRYLFNISDILIQILQFLCFRNANLCCETFGQVLLLRGYDLNVTVANLILKIIRKPAHKTRFFHQDWKSQR